MGWVSDFLSGIFGDGSGWDFGRLPSPLLYSILPYPEETGFSCLCAAWLLCFHSPILPLSFLPYRGHACPLLKDMPPFYIVFCKQHPLFILCDSYYVYHHGL